MIYDEVIKLVEKLDIHEGNNFRLMLVVAMALMQMDNEECAILLDVSRSTVERWVWGETKPHEAIRVPIWEILREKIIKVGEELDKNLKKDSESTAI